MENPIAITDLLETSPQEIATDPIKRALVIQYYREQREIIRALEAEGKKPNAKKKKPTPTKPFDPDQMVCEA